MRMLDRKVLRDAIHLKGQLTAIGFRSQKTESAAPREESGAFQWSRRESNPRP